MASAVDLISGLPDDLLLRILAFLPAASEVARTTALSSRWRHLWPLAVALRFNINSKPKTYKKAEDVDAARKLIADASAAVATRAAAGGPDVEDLEVSLVYRTLFGYIDCDPYDGFSFGHHHAADVTSAHVAAWLSFAAGRVTGSFTMALPSVEEHGPHAIAMAAAAEALEEEDAELEEGEAVDVPGGEQEEEDDGHDWWGEEEEEEGEVIEPVAQFVDEEEEERVLFAEEEEDDLKEEEAIVDVPGGQEEEDDDWQEPGGREQHEFVNEEEKDEFENEQDEFVNEEEEDDEFENEQDEFVDEEEERILFAELPSSMRVAAMNLILGQAILKIPDAGTDAFRTLTEVRLSYARLKDDNDVHRLGHLLSFSCSPMLRKLKLSYIFNLATLRLAATRALEELQLLSLHDLRSLTVEEAPNLRVLRIDGCYYVSEASIAAPALEVLEWDYPCNVKRLQFDGTASVRRIDMLNLYSHHQRFVDDDDDNSGAMWLLRNCTSARRLVMSVMFPHWHWLQDNQNYDGAEDETGAQDLQDAMEVMPELPKVNNLTVNIWAGGHTIGATVTKLIAKCAEIEYLSIKITSPNQECLYEDCICDHPKDWEFQKIYLQNLRYIKIRDFLLLDSHKRLIWVLLVSSPSLERMIVAIRTCCEGDDEEVDFDEVPCYCGHWEPFVWECSELGFIRPIKYEWMPGI
ncbi:hypothetical protein EJB05_01376, partial [Eragrostis curvula]